MTHGGPGLSRQNLDVISQEDLFWGAITSAVASDGAGRRSDWFRWEDTKSLVPSSTGNDFLERYAEDFALFAAHGLSQVRISLDWARIEPFPGRLDHDALEQTHARLIAAKDAGLSIWATLFDGSLPGWFSEDTTGFRTAGGAPLHWSRHVDRMAEMFDEYISAWVPAIDPIGQTLRSHYFDMAPPGRSSLDVTHEMFEGVLEATFDAHRLLASGSTPVIGSFALPTLHSTNESAKDEKRTWDSIIWSSWMRAITEGVLEWPWKAAVERNDLAEAFDAIDIGIASPISIDPAGSLRPWPDDASVRADATGWRPNPRLLGEVLHRVAETLPGKDLVVSGLGVADGDDNWRSELFEGWLDEILEARNDGLPIRGVFLNPAIDGYCEAAGDVVDAGVFSRGREPKPSFRWIEAQQ